MKEIKKVETECSSCGGTGIYCGFAEPKGTGVVCLNCDGTGCKMISYTPFVKIKRRNDVKKVMHSRGAFIATGIGSVGQPITYEEFFKGKIPND